MASSVVARVSFSLAGLFLVAQAIGGAFFAFVGTASEPPPGEVRPLAIQFLFIVGLAAAVIAILAIRTLRDRVGDTRARGHRLLAASAGLVFLGAVVDLVTDHRGSWTLGLAVTNLPVVIAAFVLLVGGHQPTDGPI